MSNKEKILDIIDKNKDDFIKIREYLHEYPELSNQEFKTTEFITNKLTSWGYEIEDTNLETGVIAKLCKENNKEFIAIRSDIDALPIKEKTGLSYCSKIENVSHSCGHDIHMSTLLLVAKILSELKDELNINVLFIFQPAEESLGGSDRIVDTGIFEKYDIKQIIGAHSWPFLESGKIGLLKKEFMASSDLFEIKILAKGGHGAHPEDCIDPVVIAANIILTLQTIISRSIAPLDSGVITIGKIEGGNAPNVIADEIVLSGTIRSVNNEIRSKIKNEIKNISENVSIAMGARAEVNFIDGVAALVNTPKVVERIEESAKNIIGEENVVYLAKPSMGSEDFSRYLEIVPGAMFRIGTANDDENSRLGLHNSKNIFDTNAIFAGGKVISSYILENFK